MKVIKVTVLKLILYNNVQMLLKMNTSFYCIYKLNFLTALCQRFFIERLFVLQKFGGTGEWKLKFLQKLLRAVFYVKDLYKKYLFEFLGLHSPIFPNCGNWQAILSTLCIKSLRHSGPILIDQAINLVPNILGHIALHSRTLRNPTLNSGCANAVLVDL